MDPITLDAFMAQLSEAKSIELPDGDPVAKEMFPFVEAIAKRIKKEYGMGADSSQYLLKDAVSAAMDDDLDNPDRRRTVQSYISTIAKDRDDEVILPEGIMLADYKQLPIVLYGHRYDDLGVGKNEWIVPNDRINKAQMYGLIAQTLYATIKASPKGDQVYNWIIEDMPIGSSIGFVPIEFVTPDDKAWDDLHDSWVKRASAFLRTKGIDITDALFEGVKRIFTKVLMLEYSKVMVPSNVYAVTLAVEKGLILKDEIERYTIKAPGEGILGHEELEDFLDSKLPFGLLTDPKLSLDAITQDSQYAGSEFQLFDEESLREAARNIDELELLGVEENTKNAVLLFRLRKDVSVEGLEMIRDDLASTFSGAHVQVELFPPTVDQAEFPSFLTDH